MKYGAPLLVDQLSGKVGGVVFSKARSGPTIRVRVTPSNPSSARQVAVRAALTTASREFKNLSTANAAAWRTAAQAVVLPDGMGNSFHPSGINYYTQLSAVFLAIAPTGTPPTTPPTSSYAEDTITVTGGGGAGALTFTPSAANGAGSTTELLIAPLISKNRVVSGEQYRTDRYHVFTGAGDVITISKPAGYYALAVRFVLIATGQRGPLHQLGTFQVT